jgi:3-methylcrotonyl-CoA carboxylase alpha subunit
MNTRLQVEHPVTEMITMQDLVEWQLRIAAGEELPIADQSLIPCIGHAMEARIYAENPSKDFLPAVGQVWHHSPPTKPNSDTPSLSVRTDSGVETGQHITVHYDPMISKLIVHGETREDARKELISSLKKYQIAGVPSNIPFLIQCAQHPTFRAAGKMNTGFLEENLEDIYAKVENPSFNELEQAICSIVAMFLIENRLEGVRIGVAPWTTSSGSWRMGGSQGRHERTLVPVSSDETFPEMKCISNKDGSFDFLFDNGKRTLNIFANVKHGNEIEIIINSAKCSHFTVVPHVSNAGIISVSAWPHTLETGDTRCAFGMSFQNPQPLPLSSNDYNKAFTSGEEHLKIKAPMPGKISRVNMVEGEQVEEDAVVIVMEAMKMEHQVRAPLNGIVTKLNFNVHDIVESGDILAEFEES